MRRTASAVIPFNAWLVKFVPITLATQVPEKSFSNRKYFQTTIMTPTIKFFCPNITRTKRTMRHYRPHYVADLPKRPNPWKQFHVIREGAVWQFLLFSNSLQGRWFPRLSTLLRYKAAHYVEMVYRSAESCGGNGGFVRGQ